MGLNPLDIFINTNNTVYATGYSNTHIIVWSEGSTTPTRNISGSLVSLFVTTSNDIYAAIDGVSKFTLNSTSAIPIMYT